MERLTVNDLSKVCYDPWELCGMDNYCKKGCHEEGGCTKGCHILKMYRKLAEYEDLEEKGRLLIVPKIKKNKTLYWVWGNEIMPVLFKRITGCAVDDKGNPHIMCEMETKKDRTFVSSYKRKPVEYAFKAGDKRYFYSEDIGKTVFLTREEAEAALKGLEEE